MKRFFLIPLMTLVCTVMAWGATVQVGTYSALTNALSGATAGDVIQLTANITNEAGLTITKNLTIDGQGQYTLNQYIIVSANKTLTLKGVTVVNKAIATNDKSAVCLQNGAVLVLSNATIAPDNAKVGNNSPAVRIPSGANVTVRLEEGTTNNFNCQNVHGMYSAKSGNNGKITIEGNGILNVNQTGTSGYVFSASTSTGGLYVVNAPNAHFNARSADAMYYVKSGDTSVKAIVTLNAGYYNYQPSADKIGEGKEAQLVTEGTYAGAYQIVNAPAAAQVGETEYQTFAEAFAAVPADGTIKLLKNITEAPSSDLTIAKNLTINGQGFSLDKKIVIDENKSLTLKDITVSNSVAATSPNGTVTLADGAELVLDGATITPGASNITIRTTGVTSTIRLVDGSNNAINNNGSGCLYIWDRKTSSTSGSMIIEGNGELDVNHTGTSSYIFHSNSGLGGHYYVTAPNAHFTAENADRFFYSKSKGHFTAGFYSINPAMYAADGCAVLQLAANQYQVIALDAESAVANNIKAVVAGTAYTSLAAAVEAASANAEITLWADAAATTISKHIYFVANGYNADAITAGAGYTKVALDENMFSFNSTAAASFAEFLAAEGEASFTLTEDINISEAGSLPVNGTKTLTIPVGRQIIYARQYADANIVVNEGASLKILGSGSFVPAATTYTKTVDGHAVETSATAADHIGWNIIEVKGNLELGVTGDDDNKPHFVASALNYGSCAITIAQNATATFNNAEVLAGCATVAIYGNATMNGGDYISFSNSLNGVNSGWYSYSVRCGANGHLVVNNANIKGAHGGLAVYSEGVADVYNGTIESVYGKNFKTEAEVAGNYYALYLATYGVVNVYGGKFKVEKPSAHAQNLVMYIGNNDKGTSFGIINLYGGILAEKPYLQQKRATDQDMIFPESVPLSSQWYSNVGEKSTTVPMPVGYDYLEITSGEDYDAGYRWQVVCTNPNTDVIDEDKLSEPTIPWQQATTWATDVVPEESTIVTIPAGATVVVSNAAVDIEAGGKEAVADQIFVNQGASVTVQTGTALTVGDGGMNIANGGSITVEPGATVKIGEAGIITSEEKALVLESTEDAQAILLYNPAVNENTQPKATVKLTTKSKMLAGDPTWQYTYQRFAIPIKEAMIPANDFDSDHDELFPGEEAYGFESYVYYWTGHNWATTNWSALVPFKGYQLANNSKNGGVTYTFNGNLFGNEDKAFEFQESGFDYFGNSYTAPINVESFLSGFGADVEATIWLYNYDTKNWEDIALEDLTDGFVDDKFKQIKSMDGFLLNLRAASGSAPVDYASAIWANPLLPAHAPARNKVASEINNCAVITVKDNAGFGDNLTLVEKDNYTNAFENGADASKYIMAEGVSLYAETQEGKLGRVATNDLNNTIISFRSGDNAEYTLTFGKVNGEDYLLRDNATGMTMAIAEGATYTFTQEANTTVPARFEIVGRHNTPTAIENVEAEAKAHGIYSITGQFLGHDFTVLPTGVYVVNGVKIVK